MKSCLCVAVSLIFLWATDFCVAHPFHISTAEIEWNPETRRFEVSLKLHASDLEHALSRLTGRQVHVEDNDIGEEIERYLNDCFYVTRLNGSSPPDHHVSQATVPRSKTRWVGKEMEATWIWLYFELEIPEAVTAPLRAPSGNPEATRKSGEGLVLVNKVLQEFVDEQINTVSARVAGKRHAMRMTRKQPWGELPDSLFGAAENEKDIHPDRENES